MSKKILYLFLAVAFVLFTFGCESSLVSQKDNKDWNANFVVYHGNMYVVSSERKAAEENLEKEIGKIEEYSSNEITIKNTDVIFSNHFSKGSILYTLKEVDESDSIAVKEKNNITVLVNKGKYSQ